MTAIDFILNILASITATFVIIFTATLRSKIIRRALTAIAAELLGVEIKYVYHNKKEGEDEINNILKRAHHIRIFTGRGNEFARDLLTILVGENNKEVKILMPDPDPKQHAQKFDWIDQRRDELLRFDKSYHDDVLRNQIKTNIELLMPYVKTHHLDLRLYNYPHIGRIILTENFLFLTPYKINKHGKDSAIVMYGRGEMYDMFGRTFDLIWLASNSTEALAES